MCQRVDFLFSIALNFENMTSHLVELGNMKPSNISYFYHLTVKFAKLMLIRHKRGLLDCFLDTL